MHIDRRLINFTRDVRFSFLLSILLGLFAAGTIVFQAYLLSRIINAVFLGHKNLSSVLSELIILLGISLLRAILSWGKQGAASRVAEYVKSALRRKITAHVLRLGPAFTRGERSGEISNTLLNGVDALNAYFLHYLPQLFLASLIPLLILLFVFPLDMLSGLVLLFTAPLIPLFMYLIGNIAQSLTRKQWKSLSRMSAHFLDVLQGLTTLKIFGRSKDQIEVIEKISNDFRHTTMKVLRVAFLSALVLEMVATISTAIVAVEIGLRLLYGKMDFQSALFILILAPEFYLPMRLLGTHYHAGMEGVAAARRIFQILDARPAVKLVSENGVLNLEKFVIQFDKVYFVYDPEERPALNGVSFSLPPGKKTALVGPSGAGKTTISHLLLRFIDPSEGKILVNGRDLVSIPAETWRQQIAWVPQNPYLFHNTIRENIEMANPQMGSDAVILAARQAGIHDFIVSLPDGYETVVGERGARLSGGQAQRIALARAFLKNAPLVILDEPTSNLDPDTEREIQTAMEKLMSGRTVLLIAHRLSTVQSADQILVFSRGEIREAGTHRQLLGQNGLYKRLVEAYGGME